MARKPRIHYPGAIYHVIVKGNNGEAIFFDDLCKNKYLSLLVRYKRELGFILFAFCIMTNHAHLLVAVQEVPLSQIMQRVQLVFTQWFNRTFNRTGHVFQQRYKALLCNSEIYFFELIRYIHNNPVKENLPGGFKYKWSSYGYYIGIERGNLVDITDTLEKFSKDRTEALRRYLHFMDQEQYPGDPENSEGIDMGADPRESTNLESLGENVNIGNETGKHGGGFSHRFSGDGNGTNKGERRKEKLREKPQENPHKEDK